MKKYFALTKVILKGGMGTSSSSNSKKKNKFLQGSGKVIFYIFIGLCFLPMVAALYNTGKGMFDLFSLAGKEGFALQLICYGGTFVVFLFALPYVLTVFFLSSDTETLLPMPLEPRYIVGAKFTAVLLYEYIFVTIMLFPIFTGFGIAAAFGPLYWIFVVLVCLLLPVTPIIYASLLAMLMMRIFKNVKSKEMITTIGSIVLIVAIVGTNSFLTGGSVKPEKLMAIVLGNEDLISMLNYIFPSLIFAEKALLYQSFIQIFFFIITSAAFITVFLFVADRIYFAGVMGISEVATKKHIMTSKERTAFFKGRTPIQAYANKEFKILVRTPVYFLNCMLMPLLMPLLMMVPFVIAIIQSGSKFSNSLFNVPLNIPAQFEIAIVGFAVFCFTIFISGVSYTSSTCISREGQGYIFMKYIPISYHDQLKAKVSCGVRVTFAGTVPYILLGIGFLVFAVGFSPLMFLIGIAVNVVTVHLVNYIQMFFDIAKPKLIWANEQAAVKQNFNAVLSMLMVYAIGLILGGGAVLSYIELELPIYVITCGFCVLLCGVTVLIRMAVYTYGASKLDKLEA